MAYVQGLIAREKAIKKKFKKIDKIIKQRKAVKKGRGFYDIDIPDPLKYLDTADGHWVDEGGGNYSFHPKGASGRIPEGT